MFILFGSSATGFFPYGEEFFLVNRFFSLHLWGFFPWVQVPKLTSCGVQVDFYFYLCGLCDVVQTCGGVQCSSCVVYVCFRGGLCLHAHLFFLSALVVQADILNLVK